MTTLYRITHKIPEYDADREVEVFSSFKKAEQYYNSFIERCKAEYSDEEAFCYFEKIILSKRLTNKKLFIALLAGKGFAESTEEIASWRQN